MAVIVVPVIASVILGVVAALYAAKKYKEKSRSVADERHGKRYYGTNAVRGSRTGKPNIFRVCQGNLARAWAHVRDVITRRKSKRKSIHHKSSKRKAYASHYPR